MALFEQPLPERLAWIPTVLGDVVVLHRKTPPEEARVLVDGMVELKMRVDATGNLQEIKVLSEKPPFLGFAKAALADFSDTRFIPAFRDGKPVAYDVILPVFYKAAGF